MRAAAECHGRERVTRRVGAERIVLVKLALRSCGHPSPSEAKVPRRAVLPPRHVGVDHHVDEGLEVHFGLPAKVALGLGGIA